MKKKQREAQWYPKVIKLGCESRYSHEQLLLELVFFFLFFLSPSYFFRAHVLKHKNKSFDKKTQPIDNYTDLMVGQQIWAGNTNLEAVSMYMAMDAWKWMN